ncbi:hypothetical protein Thiowin_02057 [Thiorhodovibrio winogradskyi]|uniref:Periplasmic heavy metal sensor n=2 Tax=Thiorhodovibrio winogradskyi TaxID=77007 RepID=A0ABZ0S9W2_9GAMM
MHFRFPVRLSLFLTPLLILTAGASVAESESSPRQESSRPSFLVSELVSLPHPMRVIHKDPAAFGITSEQMDRLHREVRAVYPPQLHPRVQAAWQLEKAIYQAVIERGESPSDVVDRLAELTRLKREATDIRIQALNHFRAILEPEQYQAVMAASAEAARPRP